MLINRRRFLRRAALWIAAPAIVKAANIMPVKAEAVPDYVREFQEWIAGLPPPHFFDPAWVGGEHWSQWPPHNGEPETLWYRDPPIELVGFSMSVPGAPPPEGASAEAVFDHFMSATIGQAT